VPGAQDCSPALLPLARLPGHRCRANRGLPHQRPVRRSPRRAGVRLPVPGRRGTRSRRADGRANGLDLLGPGLVVLARQEARRQRQEARDRRSTATCAPSPTSTA
jgi:hypothetical protein